jgi:hypothetical protein
MDISKINKSLEFFLAFKTACISCTDVVSKLDVIWTRITISLGFYKLNIFHFIYFM